MKRSLLPLLSLALLPPGCSGTSQDCTLIGCAGGVDVDLEGFTTTHASELPEMITACVGSVCETFEVSATGQAPICSSQALGMATCTIDGEGNVVLTALPLPEGTAGGATVSVHVTATGKTGPVADMTEGVMITESQPNGPMCGPTCLSGHVTLNL